MGDELSEYQFGGMSYSGGQPGQDQDSGFGDGQGQDQGPKWFREYMDKANQQIASLNAKLEAAETKERQAEIATVFASKGFNPAAATLYQGTPDKVDEWLERHGAALARSDNQQQDGNRPPGEMPPAGGLDPSAQADLQKMQQMGPQGSTAPGASSDDDLAAALRATNSPEEFAKVARAHGWQYDLGNMGYA